MAKELVGVKNKVSGKPKPRSIGEKKARPSRKFIGGAPSIGKRSGHGGFAEMGIKHRS